MTSVYTQADPLPLPYMVSVEKDSSFYSSLPGPWSYDAVDVRERVNH